MMRTAPGAAVRGAAEAAPDRIRRSRQAVVALCLAFGVWRLAFGAWRSALYARRPNIARRNAPTHRNHPRYP
ncbi:hypothetical protein X946_5589 [Burkholderia sp. ABCPW 111]|nr:hypothetical protein X946_5589 [Burkholderia sp. ABCPW 111]